MTETDKLKKIQEVLNEPTEVKTEVITTPNWADFPNFKPSEFVCKCGKCAMSKESGVQDMDYKLLFILQSVRNKYGVVQITCGARCQEYNDSLKGSVKNSYHIKKKASDFKITGVTNNQAKRQEIINYMSKLAGYKYAYCNVNGNYPNMGIAIHIETK